MVLVKKYWAQLYILSLTDRMEKPQMWELETAIKSPTRVTMFK
jgi:hypothetical protein